MTQPIFIAAALCAAVVIAEWLARHTWMRHLGASLVVIVVGAVMSNTGLIPVADSPVYDGVFGYVAQLAIFLLLLRVNLRDIFAAGLPMIGLFLLGCAGTVAGVFCGLWIAGGEAFGEMRAAVGGLFVATYTGGSVNFNAIALAYDVPLKNKVLFGAAVAVDSIATAVWMVATIAIPRLIGRRRGPATADAAGNGAAESASSDTETISPFGAALLIGSGLLALWLSKLCAARCADSGVTIPPILFLTTFALILAQFRAVATLPGSRMLGMFAVQIFLAVIGAYCDLSAVGDLGQLGVTLILFVSVLIVVHGAVTYGIGLLCRADPDMISVASQANIGGGTTALALARSLGRDDLELPGILVGALGNALGTYLGLIAAGWLAAQPA